MADGYAMAHTAYERIDATEERIGAMLAAGRHNEVATELKGLCRQHPQCDGLWGQYLLALYRCGRGADALWDYYQLCGRLADEFNEEPSAKLAALRQAIRARHPSLYWDGVAAEASSPSVSRPTPIGIDRLPNRLAS